MSVAHLTFAFKPYGRIEFLHSYGFLLGFDLLSRFLPRSVIEVLAEVSDKVFGRLFAKKGQHFVLCVSKPGHGEAAPLGFLCPHCGQEFEWGKNKCKSCLGEIRLIREDTADMLGGEFE